MLCILMMDVKLKNMTKPSVQATQHTYIWYDLVLSDLAISEVNSVPKELNEQCYKELVKLHKPAFSLLA